MNLVCLTVLMVRVLSILCKITRSRRRTTTNPSEWTTVPDSVPIEYDPALCWQLKRQSEQPTVPETTPFAYNVDYNWYDEQTIIISIIGNDTLRIDTVIAQVRYERVPFGQFEHIRYESLIDCPPGKRNTLYAKPSGYDPWWFAYWKSSSSGYFRVPGLVIHLTVIQKSGRYWYMELTVDPKRIPIFWYTTSPRTWSQEDDYQWRRKFDYEMILGGSTQNPAKISFYDSVYSPLMKKIRDLKKLHEVERPLLFYTLLHARRRRRRNLMAGFGVFGKDYYQRKRALKKEKERKLFRG